jgi:hypothetical protein
MALEKNTQIERIEVVGDYKLIHIREAVVITEDGSEISRKVHRYVISPCVKDENDVWSDTDISSEHQDIQDVCNAVWSDAIKTAYKDYVDSTPSYLPE